ncbi:hypothetical protein F5Y08DRAFT_293279, partial [Xylaria arbuscula]
MLSLPLPFFNPLKFLVIPFVFFVALPLSLCAGASTIVAFFILFLRLFLVYFDVGLETIRYMLLGHATPAGYRSSHSTPAVTPRASSTSMFIPPQTATNTKHRSRAKRHGSSGLLPPELSLDKFCAISPSVGLERDFEGVGGWRLDSTDGDSDNTDERQWHVLNSRLENPYRRHHSRSQSGGAVLSGNTAIQDSSWRPEPMTRSHSPEHTRRSSTASQSSSRTLTTKLCQELTKADQDYFSMHDKSTRKSS